MPTITLTDITVRSLKPVPGKRVTYLDKTIRGFGVRITENGVKSFVLTYGDDRKRVKLGDVGVVKLADAREKAKDILADYQINGASVGPDIDFDEAIEKFLKGYAEKNKASSAYGDLLHSLLPQGDGLLFTTEEGKPWNSWTDPHIALMRKASIPHFTRHDCRRFYSSTHSAIRTPPHMHEDGLWRAYDVKDGQWYAVPPNKVLKMKSWDGRSHYCGVRGTSYCLIVGDTLF